MQHEQGCGYYEMLREHVRLLMLGVHCNILFGHAILVILDGNYVILVGNVILLILGGHYEILIRHVGIMKPSLDTWIL